MLFSILATFIAGLLTPFFYERYKVVVATLHSLLLLGIISFFLTFLGPVLQGETFISNFSWIDSLDIHLSFYIDGLSLFFALLITIIGLLVLLYSYQYMKHYPKQGRFFCYLLVFMGSMLGVVLSANLISLFVFWELTSFSSFLLIGFNHQDQDSRRAARQALLVTAGGGLALMSGFIFMELMYNTGFNLIEMIDGPESLTDHKLYSAAIILISIGAISKSAQFPLHFWLPNAMAAPTPVSAYLHSATMVKAGVYLIFRMNPLFDEAALWSHLLGLTGAVTMTLGAFKALQEDDLKRILAYTTISALGIFFMMTGLGGESAINAVMVYVLAHALYKGGLFLSAGNIDHQTGTRSISQLSGLVYKMPFTSVAVMLLCASMAGIIPFLGFVGKEALYDSLFHSDDSMAVFYLVLLFLAGVFFTAVTIEIVVDACLKKGMLRGKTIREAGFLMVVAPLILAIAGLIPGVAPKMIAQPLLQWAAADIHAMGPSMELKLWHGFNAVLLLSILTILSGAGLYFLRGYIRLFRKPHWFTADFIYNKLIHGTSWLATYLTNILQNGYLRNYLAMVTGTFSVLMIFVLVDGGFLEVPATEQLVDGLQIYEVVIIALITMAVFFLFKTRSRLIVTATFGIIGYSIALAYTLFSAPDVAITQFLAETLTLILLILILHRLPSYTLKKTIEHKKYLPVALLFGMIMTVVSFIMLEQAGSPKLKNYFLESSVPAGKGQNAVNVILVDFRALDTLGEITVLVITMLGIISLLKIKPKEPRI